MKLILLFTAMFFGTMAYGQKTVKVSFTNDYPDVYHLSLLIYTPDGKNQTRVGDLQPGQVKTYSLPPRSEIYVADWKQEAFAMKGNDIRATGVKPSFVVADNKDSIVIALSSLIAGKRAAKE
jgi:hypothetical protein